MTAAFFFILLCFCIVCCQDCTFSFASGSCQVLLTHVLARQKRKRQIRLNSLCSFPSWATPHSHRCLIQYQSAAQGDVPLCISCVRTRTLLLSPQPQSHSFAMTTSLHNRFVVICEVARIENFLVDKVWKHRCGCVSSSEL
jgi:hypothetical protein